MNSEAKEWHTLAKGTDEQLAALKSEAYLTVVSAGAGTGKTQTLAQRVAWLLANDPECSINKILVLTFTKKAAAEMRDRIKKTLADWYAKFPKELDHLKKSIVSFDDAYISTIHSFAMKIIRESGLSLDIDPTSGIMPDAKADIWWSDFENLLAEASFERITMLLPDEWREKFNKFATDYYDDIIDLINKYGSTQIAQAARTCTEKLYCARNTNSSSAGQTAETLWNYDNSELIKSVNERNIKKEIYELWMKDVFPIVRDYFDDLNAAEKKKKLSGFEIKIKDLYENRSCTDAATSEEYEAFYNEVINDILVKCSGTLATEINNALNETTPENEKTNTLTKWRDKYRHLVKKHTLPSDEEIDTNRLLNKLCAIGWAAWDEFRKRENLLTQNDLIHCARQVLSSDSEYKHRFRHIMVDEFQDTDPLQNGLIDALWVHPEETDEFHNTLFLVGDPKQSIYRFRHADLTLFGDYAAQANASSSDRLRKYISLRTNFRTSRGLLQTFNDVFENVFSGNSGISYEALNYPSGEKAKARADEECETPFEILGSVNEENAEKEEKLTEGGLSSQLYADLGRRFIKMRSDKYKIWDKTLNGGEYRDVKWSDFAVLVPSRSGYSAIEREFDRLDIPFVLTTSKNYFARGEIADIVNFISLLAEPKNPLYLAGWLISPHSEISQDEAQKIIDKAVSMRQAGQSLPLLQVVTECQPQIAAKINSFRKLAVFSGVSAVIHEILKRPSFLKYYSGLRRRRVYANISYLAQLAEEYEKSQGISLSGCADYLNESVSNEGATEEPETCGAETDAVRVMTIHASKGLEFPVTAVIYKPKQNNDRGKIAVSKRFGVTAKKLHDKNDVITWLWEKEYEDDEEAAEQNRLWYVGFTRAKDKLFFAYTDKSGKKNKDDDAKQKSTLLGTILSKPERVQYIEKSEDKETDKEQYAKSSVAAPLALPVTEPAKLGRLSASAYALLSWCPSAYRTVYRQGRAINWTVKGGEGKGSAFGSLAHLILSKWDFTKDGLRQWFPNDENFNSVIQRIPVTLRSEYINEKHRSEIENLLLNYSETEECKEFSELAAAGKLFREVRFRTICRETVLVGSCDIFWEDSNVFHLRDWKSADERFAPEWYYEKQLEFYSFAVHTWLSSRNKNKNIDSALIYLRSHDTSGKIRRYSKEDFQAIEESIEAAAITGLAGSFSANRENCASCPWKEECPENCKDNKDTLC
ncbi:MAG: UvrD-helicase domain-containing protein [Synergistes sp.]|nr:UvrD-helicase domain-containing protein [Synergistes sp.]